MFAIIRPSVSASIATSQSLHMMAAFSLLLDLPFGPTQDILVHWLRIEDVVRLDSAHCNRYHRTEFLSRIDNNEIVFDTGLRKIGGKFIDWLIMRRVRVRNLKLRSSRCAADTAANIALFQITGQHITSITIDSCYAEPYSFMDVNLTDIARGCPCLSELVILMDCRIGESISEVLLNCKNIKVLTLYDFVGFKASYLWEIPCENLNKLSLLSPVDDELLVQISKVCQNLTHLCISGSETLTDIGVSAIAQGVLV